MVLFLRSKGRREALVPTPAPAAVDVEPHQSVNAPPPGREPSSSTAVSDGDHPSKVGDLRNKILALAARTPDMRNNDQHPRMLASYLRSTEILLGPSVDETFEYARTHAAWGEKESVELLGAARTLRTAILKKVDELAPGQSRSTSHGLENVATRLDSWIDGTPLELAHQSLDGPEIAVKTPPLSL